MIPKDFSEALDAGNQAIIILKNPQTNEAQVRMPSGMSLYEAFGIVEHIARRMNLELMHVSDGRGDDATKEGR